MSQLSQPFLGTMESGEAMHSPIQRRGRLSLGALFHLRAGYFLGKRALDFLIASTMLVVATPVMALIGLLVKLTSRGPVLYTQARVGRQGRIFTIYKFRTMIHQCESLTGPRWCVPGDPRVTPVGAVLRATHLDELPQLWNVIRGDMSLVGPRPERPEFVIELEQQVDGYPIRYLVKPGITGLAQISLPSDVNLHSVRNKLRYDLAYLERMSLTFDLLILVKTIRHVFRGHRGK